MLTIEMRTTGRRRPAVPDWQVPADGFRSGSPLTLRDLIERMVHGEVDGFRQRQAEQRLTRFLSAEAIEAQAAGGRVDLGGRSLEQEVDADQAVGTALESFEDGLYLVLIDGRQYDSLDEQVQLGEESRLTFLRLVPLAGG